MAAIRRTGVKDFPRLNNQRIEPHAYSVLNRVAGRRCLGAAVEDLVMIYETLESNGLLPAIRKRAASVRERSEAAAAG